MNKNNYLKLFFVLLLLSGSFFGCGNNDSQNGQSTTDGETAAEVNNTDNNNLDATTISKFYYEGSEKHRGLKFALEDGFLNKLEKAYKNNNLDEFTQPHYPDQQLEEMKKEIVKFRNDDLDNITNKEEAEKILDRIDKHLEDISSKVTVHFKDAKEEVTQDTIELVREELGVSEDQEIFGKQTKTYNAIKDFINEKKRALEGEIKDLNAIVDTPKPPEPENEKTVKEELEEVKKDVEILQEDVKGLNNEVNVLKGQLEVLKTNDQRFRLIFILSGIFGVLLIVFALDKNRRMSSFGKGLSQDNQEALYNLQTEFNQKLANLQKQQNKFKGQIQQIDQTVTSTEQILINRVDEIEAKIPISGNNQRGQLTNYNPSWQNPTTPANDFTGVSVTPSPSHSQTSPSSHTNINNYSSSSVPSNGVAVSETKRSQEDRRLGKSKAVILEKNRRGNYLVYTEGNYEYLVPSENLRINEFNYKTFEVLFEINNFNASSSTDFHIKHPAVVSSISSGEQWELQQRGVLQF
ncbi:MAG: hypothetical protein QNJ42_23090 [Crocosphaera sp.]|nr:hypothetical protein [Crocosphaera sp.]